MFEAVQGRIERALLNFQAIFRNLLNAQQNTVAVKWSERNGLEDQHVQGALQQIDLFFHDLPLCV